MKPFLLILVLLPAVLQASCGDDTDPGYTLAVGQGDYAQAFEITARELHLTPEEKSHFKIVEGFSRTHDDRHGQADPDTQSVSLDPGLFIEGKDGACQGVAHELTHLRQFERDRRRLHDYYAAHPVAESGWNGCDHDALSRNADEAEKEAYDCLQDNDLAAHAAAMDIEAVMAQVRWADHDLLRDEDVDYLTENLTQWASHQTMITDHSNESYYLPAIKREDVATFCRGYAQAGKWHADAPRASQAWLLFCRGARL